MAIFEQQVDISNFIQLTTGGVTIASFADIRDTLIKKMKWIYGNDIDVSSATADGQWLNQVALLINNCCQIVKYAYEMLDPASATGIFLDILCSYNNIQRRRMTNSIAQLQVKNISGAVQDKIGQLIFTDKNGNTWTWNNPGKNIDGSTINPNTEINWNIDEVKTLVNVKCDEMGQIEAYGTHIDPDWTNYNVENAGSINQTLEYGKWQVYQKEDAETGYIDETDEALRSRRIQSLGNQSVSVLSGLEGALLNISGIDDVWVFNNNTSGDNATMSDGTIVAPHEVYVCLKYNDTIPNSTIGNLIYNKLTPGIPTKDYDKGSVTQVTGANENFKIAKTSAIIYNIYWKKCSKYPFNNVITQSGEDYCIKVTLNLLTDNFDYDDDTGAVHQATTDVEKSIVKNILEYINNIKLGENLNAASIITATQKGDILKNNFSTFFATACQIEDGSSQIFDLKLTYAEFSESDFWFITNKTVGQPYSTGYVLIKG